MMNVHTSEENYAEGLRLGDWLVDRACSHAQIGGACRNCIASAIAEALEKRNEEEREIRAALRPFAEAGELFMPANPNDQSCCATEVDDALIMDRSVWRARLPMLTIGHLRTAARTLRERALPLPDSIDTATFRHKTTGEIFTADTYSLDDRGTVWLQRLRTRGDAYLLGGDAEIDVRFAADPVNEAAREMLAQAESSYKPDMSGARDYLFSATERIEFRRSSGERDTQRPEHILCAAIWVDTGEAEPPRRSFAYPTTGILFCGWRHGDCFVSLGAWASRLSAEEKQRIGEEQIAGRNQGFLTSKGRFVDRKEAMAIARAAGQTTSEKSDLFSEDLY